MFYSKLYKNTVLFGQLGYKYTLDYFAESFTLSEFLLYYN